MALAAAPPTKGKPAAPRPAAPAATATVPSPTAAQPPKRIFPFPIEEHLLPNGLRVLLVKFDSPGLVGYYSLVRTGSRNEVEPGHTGFAHFFEHMMFRGTEKHPKEQYDELLSQAGVSNNAFTTDDCTAFHAFGPTRALPLIIELEADRFQNLKYPEDDFRTEAKAVLGEYNKNYSNPTEKMEEALLDTAFSVHPYKHTTMGFKADVEAMPSRYAYSLEFFKRWYRPDNTTLIVVGDFDAASTLQLIEKAYGSWSGRSATIAIPSEPPQTRKKAVNVSWANPTQPRLVLAWHTPETRVSTPWAALQNVLGPYLFGPTSPLYNDLVLERQLVTSLSGTYWDHRDPNLFGVFATLKSEESFGEVQKAIDATLAELRAGKVDAKRLEDIKSNQKYGLLNSFDEIESVGLALVFSISPTGDPRALDALFNHMDALQPKDLVEFAKTRLIDTNSTAVTLVGAGAKPPPGIPEYTPQPAPSTGDAKKGGAR
ncbi:MAG: insulinase family protein [Deltaproteobacteria bacterium]|nr:insulinase family protein [Deltaproteobacteria bacterium]